MADKDSSIIKSVESLQNITGLKPTKRREERKRRQSSQKQEEKSSEQQFDESLEEQQDTDGLAQNHENPHTIDYRA